MEFDELIMKIETDDDSEGLFVELPESCEEEEMFDVKSPISINQSSLPMPPQKEIKIKCEKNILAIDEPSCSKSSCSGDHKRDEDVIFGELVTSMLSKMEDDEKRKMKKAIMNILL